MGSGERRRLKKRYTVSFNSMHAARLEELANRDEVTVSRVVRTAVERYLQLVDGPQMQLRFDLPKDGNGHG